MEAIHQPWNPAGHLRAIPLRILSSFALAVVGAAAGGVFAFFTVEQTLTYFIYGAADGFWIALLMAMYSLMVLPGPVGRPIRRLSFRYKIALNTAIYLALYGGGTSIARLTLSRPAQIPIDAQFWASVGYAIALLTLVNFVVEMCQLVGFKAVVNFIRGIYHRPVEEDRVFLFVDLVGSTTLAEKIGNRAFMDFLNLFFSCLSEAVMESNAEIYKYVGDEAILTWKTPDAVAQNHALRCVFMFQSLLDRAAPRFEKKFGHRPRVRAAIHRGNVIVGELGDSRKEIAYLGDVVNSTARLMETAREHETSVVLSEDFVRAIQTNPPVKNEIQLRKDLYVELVSLGEIELRGKRRSIQVYSAEQVASRRE